jgi:hypothetical protein
MVTSCQYEFGYFMPVLLSGITNNLCVCTHAQLIKDLIVVFNFLKKYFSSGKY